MNKDKKITIIIAVVCVICVAGSLVAGYFMGRHNEQSDYDYMLDNDGMYMGLDGWQIDLPDFDQIQVKADDILKFAYPDKDIDEKVNEYANFILDGLFSTNKSTAIQYGDTVVVEEEVFINNDSIYGGPSANTITIQKGDQVSELLVGKKVGDIFSAGMEGQKGTEYEGMVGYTQFNIIQVKAATYLKEGFVEDNLKEIQKTYPSVQSKEDFLAQMKILLASNRLSDYYKYKLENAEIEFPEKYAEAELYRIKTRLAEIGYTYEDYLESSQKTDEQVKQECTNKAAQNILIMKIYEKLFGKGVDAENLHNVFYDLSENQDEIENIPYHKLEYMKFVVIDRLMTHTQIV